MLLLLWSLWDPHSLLDLLRGEAIGDPPSMSNSDMDGSSSSLEKLKGRPSRDSMESFKLANLDRISLVLSSSSSLSSSSKDSTLKPSVEEEDSPASSAKLLTSSSSGSGILPDDKKFKWLLPVLLCRKLNRSDSSNALELPKKDQHRARAHECLLFRTACHHEHRSTQSALFPIYQLTLDYSPWLTKSRSRRLHPKQEKGLSEPPRRQRDFPTFAWNASNRRPRRTRPWPKPDHE